MSSFESKLEAFLENYEKLKSVENEEAFLREFIVREFSLDRKKTRASAPSVSDSAPFCFQSSC